MRGFEKLLKLCQSTALMFSFQSGFLDRYKHLIELTLFHDIQDLT